MLVSRPTTFSACSAKGVHQRSSRQLIIASASDRASRREMLAAGGMLVASGVFFLDAPDAQADGIEAAAKDLFKKDLNKARRKKIPIEAYTEVPGVEGGPNFKIFEVKVGTGLEATPGARVAVHYELRWKGVTFQTSRMGMGVTGGSPLGFNIGAQPGMGGTLKGLDLATKGMKVGGQRKALLPPEYGYGAKGYGEIPPNATLELDVELLSIQTSAFGSQVKIVEG